MSASDVPVETAIDFVFTDRRWLVRALTHSSYRGEAGLERVPEFDNEQLEFLGDAILGFVVGEHLFRTCPEFNEGMLSNVKSRLVNRMHLADVAAQLGIGRHLLMGKGEEKSGGRDKTSLLANALEAILGAIYLDAGMPAVRRVVLEHIVAGADVRSLAVALVNNVKTSLEVAARSRGFPPPEYSVRAEHGGFPQMFVAEVRVGKEWRGDGRASSKKGAEIQAATALLAMLEKQA